MLSSIGRRIFLSKTCKVETLGRSLSKQIQIKRWIATQRSSLVWSQSSSSDGVQTQPPSQSALELNWRYSDAETNILLNILNSGEVPDLAAYKISKSRATKLIKYRSKHGKFEHVSQVLHVDDFGVNLLQQLCHRIINGVNYDPVGLNNAKSDKQRKTIAVSSPPLSTELRATAQSVLGIQITPSALSWAKLDRQNTIQAWGACDLLEDEKRQHHGALLKLVHNALESLPEADIYVMEERGGLLMGMGSNVALSTQLMQIQAMLIALLNPTFDSELCNHQVYTIKAGAIMRIFDIQVGAERVSGQTIVDKMLYTPSIGKAATQDEDNEIPGFSHVMFTDDARNVYKSRNVYERENLANSLLIALAYSDLVLHERRSALDIIHKSNKKQ